MALCWVSGLLAANGNADEGVAAGGRSHGCES